MKAFFLLTPLFFAKELEINDVHTKTNDTCISVRDFCNFTLTNEIGDDNCTKTSDDNCTKTSDDKSVSTKTSDDKSVSNNSDKNSDELFYSFFMFFMFLNL